MLCKSNECTSVSQCVQCGIYVGIGELWMSSATAQSNIFDRRYGYWCLSLPLSWANINWNEKKNCCAHAFIRNSVKFKFNKQSSGELMCFKQIPLTHSLTLFSYFENIFLFSFFFFLFMFVFVGITSDVERTISSCSVLPHLALIALPFQFISVVMTMPIECECVASFASAVECFFRCAVFVCIIFISTVSVSR